MKAIVQFCRKSLTSLMHKRGSHVSWSFHFCLTRQHQGKDWRSCPNNTQRTSCYHVRSSTLERVEGQLWTQGCRGLMGRWTDRRPDGQTDAYLPALWVDQSPRWGRGHPTLCPRVLLQGSCLVPGTSLSIRSLWCKQLNS